MTTVFGNVTIIVPDAKTSQEAYDKLCAVLGKAGFYWRTDDSLYTEIVDNRESEPCDTVLLWPA
jgi:hypothetical protein